MSTRSKRKNGFNFIDRILLAYMRKRDIERRPESRMYGYLEGKARTPEDKEVLNRLIMPWLYRNMNYRGIIRDTDVLELRRLSQAPIVQLCIGTRQEEVKKTPWAIIETDQRDKKYLSKTSILDRDRNFLKTKADQLENNPKLSELADEVAYLLSNPNSQGQTFEHLVGMLIADHAEAGDAIWVLSFNEEDVRMYHDKEEDVLKPRIRKGARPVEIECRDVLQFNKDMDDYGQLKGYWFVPNMSGGSGFAGVQTYVTKDEVIWFPNDPRSNRFYGYGDVEKARDVIDILMLSMEQEAQYFGEGMVSPGALALDGDDISQADVEQTIDYYQENIKGHPDKMWILNKKASWLPFTFNYRELQFLERKLWDSKIITSVFKLNTSMLGISPDMTNRATMHEERIIAMEKGIIPKMKMIEYYINTQLIWKYYSRDLSFVYDPVSDLESMEKKGQMVFQGYMAGIMKLNEARKEIGLEEVPEGDEFKPDPSAQQDNSFGNDDPLSGIFNKESKKKIRNDGVIDIPNSEYSKLYRDIRKLYGKTFDDIIKALKAYKPEIDVSSNADQETKAVARSSIVGMILEVIQKNGLVERLTETIMLNSAGDMLKVIKEQATALDLGFDSIKEEDAIRRLTERKMSYYQEIPDTLTDTVIQTLVDTIDQGASYGEAVDKLKVLREDFTTHRAETIVRTEVGRSRKEATLMFGMTYKDLLLKKWVSTKDRRCRPSHLAMDGKTVEMDQPFIVPYGKDNKKYTDVAEMYPGESKWGINCRCTLDNVKKKGV